MKGRSLKSDEVNGCDVQCEGLNVAGQGHGGCAISGAFEVAARRVRSQEHHRPGHPSRGGPTRAAGARRAWLGTKRGGSRAGAMSGCREYLKGTTHRV